MIWIVLGLLSALSAALVAIFAKLGLSSIDTTLATTIRAIIMASFFVVTSLTLGKAKLLHTIDSHSLFYIVLAGLAGALSWFFYFAALKLGPASGVAALDRLSVVFVVITAALLLGEQITLKVGIGATLIAVGAFLMTIR